MLKNYYQILNISPNATKNEIKKAYKLFVFKFHPDKHQNDPFFKERFIEVQEAYEILFDDYKRKEYDEQFYDNANFDKNEEPIVSIQVSSQFIDFGESVTFVWNTQNVSELQIVNHGYYPTNGEVTFTPEKTSEYVFLFSNESKTVKEEITIQVKRKVGNITSWVIGVIGAICFISLLFIMSNKPEYYADSYYEEVPVDSIAVEVVEPVDSIAVEIVNVTEQTPVEVPKEDYSQTYSNMENNSLSSSNLKYSNENLYEAKRKAFFYSLPNEREKTELYMERGGIVEIKPININGGFGFVDIEDRDGNMFHGWFKMSDFSKVYY